MNEPQKYPSFIGEDLRRRYIYDALLKILEPQKDGIGKPVKEIEIAVSKELASTSEEVIPDYLIYRTLRAAGSASDSRIQSGGPWKGYYLSSETEDEIGSTNPKLAESELYKLVREWLIAEKGFLSVRADLHAAKKNKEWGNPDIIALAPHSVLGRSSEIEIATAEVKLSLDGWRKWIFEAVSHTRFADRSYFVFRTGADSKISDRNSLLYYAEKFGVGLVQIPMSDDQADGLKKLNKLSQQEFGAQAKDYVDAFVEIFPAPSKPVPLSEKALFLSNLGLANEQDLWRFGNAP